MNPSLSDLLKLWLVGRGFCVYDGGLILEILDCRLIRCLSCNEDFANIEDDDSPPSVWIYDGQLEAKATSPDFFEILERCLDKHSCPPWAVL